DGSKTPCADRGTSTRAAFPRATRSSTVRCGTLEIDGYRRPRSLISSALETSTLVWPTSFFGITTPLWRPPARHRHQSVLSFPAHLWPIGHESYLVPTTAAHGPGRGGHT